MENLRLNQSAIAQSPSDGLVSTLVSEYGHHDDQLPDSPQISSLHDSIMQKVTSASIPLQQNIVDSIDLFRTEICSLSQAVATMQNTGQQYVEEVVRVLEKHLSAQTRILENVLDRVAHAERTVQDAMAKFDRLDTVTRLRSHDEVDEGAQRREDRCT